MRFLPIELFPVFKWFASSPLLLPLLIFTTHVKAQSPPLVFRNFSVNDGLSYNFIRGVFQDSRGFIWISTIDGLNKFDGYTFQNCKVKQDDTTSLSSNNVSNALVEDAHGNLWVGTWGGGICIYDRKSDRFRRLCMNVRIVFHTDGPIQNPVLILADPVELTFTTFAHDPANPASPSHNAVHAITEDDEGNLWIGTLGGGLNRFNPETRHFVRYLHQEGDHEGPANNLVAHVFCDSKKLEHSLSMIAYAWKFRKMDWYLI